jgi:GNAT superfamily N-acetyltransferase
MTATIRSARPDDAAALAELRWEFRAGRTAPTEDRQAFLDRCAAWMREELAAGGWRAWVAEADGGIVGQCWLHVIRRLPNPNGASERHAYFSNLYVTPAARGGVGTRLVSAAIDWCDAAGVDTMILWPTPRSRPLYMRHGFSDRVEFLALKLSRSAGASGRE